MCDWTSQPQRQKEWWCSIGEHIQLIHSVKCYCRGENVYVRITEWRSFLFFFYRYRFYYHQLCISEEENFSIFASYFVSLLFNFFLLLAEQLQVICMVGCTVAWSESFSVEVSSALSTFAGPELKELKLFWGSANTKGIDSFFLEGKLSPVQRWLMSGYLPKKPSLTSFKLKLKKKKKTKRRL